MLTLSGTPTTGDSVFPYSYNSGNGQLTMNQNSSQPLNVNNATAIVATNFVYVLANEPVTIGAGGIFAAGTYPSQILPFSVGTNGALQQQTGGTVPGDSNSDQPGLS